MSAATIASGPFRFNVPANTVGANSDDLVEEYGTGTWSGATVDVDELALTYIEEVVCATFNPIKATGYTAADGAITTDGIITSGAITVARVGHTESTASYYYRILGKRKQS